MLHHGPLPVQRSDGIGSTKPSIKTDGYIIYWKVTPDGATDDTRLQIHRETVNFSADSITLDIHLPSAIPHTLTEFRYKDFALELTTLLVEGSDDVVLSTFLYKLPIELIKCGFGNTTDEDMLVGSLKLSFSAKEFAKLRRDDPLVNEALAVFDTKTQSVVDLEHSIDTKDNAQGITKDTHPSKPAAAPTGSHNGATIGVKPNAEHIVPSNGREYPPWKTTFRAKQNAPQYPDSIERDTEGAPAQPPM